MAERTDQRKSAGNRPHHRNHRPLRHHPKPPLGSVGSLNQAIRQELWFVDTMAASPFRAMRRQLQTNGGPWAQGADEALWALEGMTRLPIKVMQAAFGETLFSKNQSSDSSDEKSGDEEKSQDSPQKE